MGRLSILAVTVLSSTVAIISTTGFFRSAIAGEACSYRLGKSVAGSPMSIDLCSI